MPTESECDVPAKIKLTATPVYPRDAYLAKKAGTANVKAVVSTSGTIMVSQIKASAPEFEQALQAAIDAMRFTPAWLKGSPVNYSFTLDFNFDGRFISDEGRRIARLLQKNDNEIREARELDSKPSMMFTVPARYPQSLAEKRPEGEASVEIVADKEGLVHWSRVVSASDPAFGAAAVHAVSLWKFEKATIKDEDVIWRGVVPFHFSPK